MSTLLLCLSACQSMAPTVESTMKPLETTEEVVHAADEQSAAVLAEPAENGNTADTQWHRTLEPEPIRTIAVPTNGGCQLQLNFKLADSPGPHGHPFASAPWLLVQSETAPEGMALVEDAQILARGLTDEQGQIQLDSAATTRVSAVFCAQPEQIWLMYPGQQVRLQALNLAAAQSPAERLFIHLKLAGFFADVASWSTEFAHSAAHRSALHYARQVYGVKTDRALLAQFERRARQKR